MYEEFDQHAMHGVVLQERLLLGQQVRPPQDTASATGTGTLTAATGMPPGPPGMAATGAQPADMATECLTYRA